MPVISEGIVKSIVAFCGSVIYRKVPVEENIWFLESRSTGFNCQMQKNEIDVIKTIKDGQIR